ncbi:MAG TPA: P-loop NTPase [Candidatus Deferrimicrobium sp.]|nr:P-loop NTPase [Candidatus Deferrimicrobium sp.]
MKIAISGKGGVGKSTLAAALALLMARQGQKVLALDADPDANLAAALGIPGSEQRKIIPISQHVALIEERTGAKVKQYGQVFKLNPEVSDIADKYATVYEGVALLVLGAVEQGGSGCACPENVLIRSLVMDLVLNKNEALIMDMEAGIEHLGRATSRGVDCMIVVIEPGQRSIDSANKIIRMAHEIGLKNIRFVANKVDGTNDEQFIRQAFPNHDLLGIIPYSEEIRRNDRNGLSVLDGISKELMNRFEEILRKLLNASGGQKPF